MTHLYATLQALATTSRLRVPDARQPSRTRRRPGEDSGLSTLEVVVIALGLFLLASALVAAITVAVNSRMNQIQ